jgi:hypothetical protein
MSKSAAAPAGMSGGLTLLFAVAGGFAVGNLYWTQPLLASIASTFGVSAAAGHCWSRRRRSGTPPGCCSLFRSGTRSTGDG